MSDKIMYNTIQTILADLKRKLSMDRDETVKGQYTFEKFPDLPSSEQNTFLEESIEKGALDSFGQRIVDEGLSDGLRERFIGQGLGQQEVTTKSLDSIPQSFYRNLEGDNTLPLRDYDGRTRPIGTAIAIADIEEINGEASAYIVENMPYIKDLIKNPSNWLVFVDTTGNTNLPYDGWGDYTNTAVKILTVEYIGDYNLSKNCYRITTNSPIVLNNGIGDSAFVFSFKAYGLNIRYNPAFPRSSVVGEWNYGIDDNNTYIHPCFYFKHSDNYYVALASSFNKITNKIINKWLTATNPFTDDWVPIHAGNTDDLADLLPDTYNTFNEITGICKKHNSDSTYITAVGIGKSNYGSISKIALLEYNEDLTHRRLILPDLSGYTFNIGMSSIGYGITYAFYKGKHLISLVDGSHNTGKGIVLSSNRLDGPYTLHSTIYNRTEDAWLKLDESLFKISIASISLLVYNSELYAATSGQPGDVKTGLAAKHEMYLWKYSDAENTWNLTVAPFIMALHGNRFDYPELEEDFGFAHLGATSFGLLDGNKLWLNYKGRDSGGYQGTIGYIDLDKALS